jgi:WD40 repeat protein
VAATPEGLFATAVDDKRIVLRLGASQPLVLEGHTARIRALAFDSTHKILASGGDDRTVILWDVRTGKARRRLQIASSIDVIHSLAWSPAKPLLAIAGRDGRVRMLDLATGKLKTWKKLHKDFIRNQAFSKDGKLLATAGRDGVIWMWDARTGTPLYRLDAHHDDINSIEFDATSRYLLTASDDKTVKLWDLSARKLESAYTSVRPITAARFVPNSSSLLFIDDLRKLTIIEREGVPRPA